MKRRSWLWSLAGMLAVAGLSYAVFLGSRPPALPDGFVYANGRIEGTEVRLASEVAGRVIDHRLVEGKTVSAGEQLVTIDPETSRDRLRTAESELASLQSQRGALASQIETWEHHVAVARRHLERVERLVDSGSATPRDLDRAENGLREAESQLERMRAERGSLEKRVEGAEAQVRLARNRLEETGVVAPQAGTVLVRAVEVGEVVAAGQPLAVLVDLSRLELKVYVPERLLGRVRLGSEARVRVDAYPDDRMKAQVARVDDYAQFTPRDIHMPEERVRMVYGVTLTLDNPDGRFKPGMPADAWMRTDPGRDWPASLPVPGR